MLDPRVKVSERHPVVCQWYQLASQRICTDKTPQRGQGSWASDYCISPKIVEDAQIFLAGSVSLMEFITLVCLMPVL